VAVEGGVVTLRGHLQRRTGADQAAELSAQVDGVVAVHNQLTFSQDDTRYHELVRPNW
jgi:osmotically-inducible protein OsmY